MSIYIKIKNLQIFFFHETIQSFQFYNFTPNVGLVGQNDNSDMFSKDESHTLFGKSVSR